jgi:hypothetical protein
MRRDSKHNLAAALPRGENARIVRYGTRILRI